MQQPEAVLSWQGIWDSLFRHDDNLVQCIHIDDVAIYFADAAIHLNKVKVELESNKIGSRTK